MGKAEQPPAPHTTWRARPLRRGCHSNPASQSEAAAAAGGEVFPVGARVWLRPRRDRGRAVCGCAAALPRSDATAGAGPVAVSRVVATPGPCRDIRAWPGALRHCWRHRAAFGSAVSRGCSMRGRCALPRVSPCGNVSSFIVNLLPTTAKTARAGGFP